MTYSYVSIAMKLVKRNSDEAIKKGECSQLNSTCVSITKDFPKICPNKRGLIIFIIYVTFFSMIRLF